MKLESLKNGKFGILTKQELTMCKGAGFGTTTDGGYQTKNLIHPNGAVEIIKVPYQQDYDCGNGEKEFLYESGWGGPVLGTTHL